MEIRALTQDFYNRIYECIHRAFADYVGGPPQSPEETLHKFAQARINFELSFGAFEEGKLVGVMVNALDTVAGEMCAFNLVSGVLPEHRGKGLLGRLFSAAVPVLQTNGAKRLRLEVIPENEVVVNAYRRLGMQVRRELWILEGKVPDGLRGEELGLMIEQAAFWEVSRREEDEADAVAWLAMRNGILRMGKRAKTFAVRENGGNRVGYFVGKSFPAGRTRLVRTHAREGGEDLLLRGIMAHFGEGAVLEFDGVDAGRMAWIDCLRRNGFVSVGRDLEMELLF